KTMSDIITELQLQKYDDNRNSLLTKSLSSISCLTVDEVRQTLGSMKYDAGRTEALGHLSELIRQNRLPFLETAASTLNVFKYDEGRLEAIAKLVKTCDVSQCTLPNAIKLCKSTLKYSSN